MTVLYNKASQYRKSMLIGKDNKTYICDLKNKSITCNEKSSYGVQYISNNQTEVLGCPEELLQSNINLCGLGANMARKEKCLSYIKQKTIPNFKIELVVANITQLLNAIITKNNLDITISLEIITVKKIKINEGMAFNDRPKEYFIMSYIVNREGSLISNDFIVVNDINQQVEQDFANEIIAAITWNDLEKHSIVIDKNDTIFLRNKAAGMIFHEFLGHLLEADNYHCSPISLSENKKVCDSNINIFENYLSTGHSDDFGNSIEKNIAIIRKGKINRVLTNQIYANILGKKDSGNAITEEPDGGSQIRMRHMYVQEGNVTVEEGLSQIKNGILIEKISMGEVNMYTGDFFLLIERAYQLVNGKEKKAISVAPLHFNFKTFAQKKILLCKDILQFASLCGKMGSVVKVDYSCPSMILFS